MYDIARNYRKLVVEISQQYRQRVESGGSPREAWLNLEAMIFCSISAVQWHH